MGYKTVWILTEKSAFIGLDSDRKKLFDFFRKRIPPPNEWSFDKTNQSYVSTAGHKITKLSIHFEGDKKLYPEGM